MQNLEISIDADTKIQEPVGAQIETKVAGGGGKAGRWLFRVLFILQLILITILAIVLTIRGLILADRHHFQPKKWYPPLLASTGSAGIVACSWQWLTVRNPSRALKAAFWLSPLLTCAVGILFVLIESPGSLAVGVIAVIFAIIQSLYACWVNRRFEYASKVLSVSMSSFPTRASLLVALSVTASVFYSSFMVSGIGGASATSTWLDIIFISVIMLSLAWSMQVIKNVLQVTIARVRYLHFACAADMDTRVAFRDTIKFLLGNVCIGSSLVPVIVVIRGSARGMSLIAEGTDEFLFSCTNCYSQIASTLVKYGNRWGFVQVGVYNKGFVQASMDTWEMFGRVGLETLIDMDLTGVFCFLCGVTGGAISALVAGTWAVFIHKSYATELSFYAFLIGYFMCRIAMASPQSSVSAYYVAYAENPNSTAFDSTIPERLQEIHRYRAYQS
ncbi:putative gd2b [Tripterygium wilfordii]|uniref:Choline transporter-like protein n=1 Tax=Tripterygium wilfordii TaxID=458696 RepID=A0A7J7BV30_TRIWF|nr:protein PNS1-like isoform X2 [Tripterygium wilfordii]KAF5725752.1 putative gd2b [Tripterygium wilfordii]